MEESFDPIAQTRANYYTPGSPVQFVRVDKGSVSGDRAVCLTFKNISRVNLTALEIHFKCKTTGGEILCEDEFAYRDLDVKPGELFGMDDAVFITQKPITSVDVVLRNVYNGKRVVRLDDIKRVRLPAPRRLPDDLAAALEERMGQGDAVRAPGAGLRLVLRVRRLPPQGGGHRLLQRVRLRPHPFAERFEHPDAARAGRRTGRPARTGGPRR